MTKITSDRLARAEAKLREYLSYDPETGLFRWIKRPRGLGGSLERPAGNMNKVSGYVQIRFCGILFYGHRLAWWFMNGEWPSEEIDHWNRKRGDNRYKNLRDADHSQNSSNGPPLCGRKLKGSYFDAKNGRWYSSINVRMRTIHLGRFDAEADAARAYDAAARKHFGEFARLNFHEEA